MRSLQREIEATMIIVTHDPDEAALLADEILILDKGRVLQTGETEAVFARPASETVARLLGAENVAFGIAVNENQIEIGNGVRLVVAGPLLLQGSRVAWGVRPDQIRLGDNGCYAATIEGVTSFGGSLQLTLHLGDASLLVLADRRSNHSGGPCRLDIDPHAIQVWEA
jgi:molybdate transport system permease protein